MGSARIYLDYNATAPATPAAVAMALAAIESGGNPSSVHGEGRQARAFVETARRRVAALAGPGGVEVCFTSGGTEAANFALRSIAMADGRPVHRLLVGATEHAAVLSGHGFEAGQVQVVSVDRQGVIDLEHLRRAMRTGGPAVVALQAANNETGVLQPVADAAAIVRAEGGVLVCDAVQAAGRIPCHREALDADVLLLSGHKLGGLPGAGAVLVRSDAVRLTPLLRGGGQERGLRGGTENVPTIAAFGVAIEAVRHAPDAARLARLRDGFEAALRDAAPDVVIFSGDAVRLPNTCAFAVPGVSAERLMMALDLGGVAVSSGSACSSGKVGRSHVLEAMGIGDDLRSGAIRVSFGWGSLDSDVGEAVAVLKAALHRMRRPARAAA